MPEAKPDATCAVEECNKYGVSSGRQCFDLWCTVDVLKKSIQGGNILTSPANAVCIRGKKLENTALNDPA